MLLDPTIDTEHRYVSPCSAEGFAKLKGGDIRKFSTLSLLSLFRRILKTLSIKWTTEWRKFWHCGVTVAAYQAFDGLWLGRTFCAVMYRCWILCARRRLLWRSRRRYMKTRGRRQCNWNLPSALSLPSPLLLCSLRLFDHPDNFQSRSPKDIPLTFRHRASCI